MNNAFIILILITVLCLFSCVTKEKLIQVDQDSENIKLLRSEIEDFLDLIIVKKLNFASLMHAVPKGYFRLNRLILLNDDQDRFYTTINIKSDVHRSDCTQSIYGVKSRTGKWLIFEGSGYTLIRDYDISGYSDQEYFDYLDMFSYQVFLSRFIILENGITKIDSKKIEESIKRNYKNIGMKAMKEISEIEHWESLFEYRTNNEILTDEQIAKMIKEYNDGPKRVN